MPVKFILKFSVRLLAFVLMLLLGAASFNSYHLREKIEMLRLAEDLHQAQIDNDKQKIDNLLTDNFTETGVKDFPRAPDAIDKRDYLKPDYSQINFTIETQYPLLLNIFGSSDNSVSFVRKLALIDDNGDSYLEVYCYVTYTFEKTADGLKISKIERKL